MGRLHPALVATMASLALAALWGGSAAIGANRHAFKCRRAPGKTLLHTRTGRVFVTEHGDFRAWGCLYSVNRRVDLLKPHLEDFIGPARIAGRYVGYVGAFFTGAGQCEISEIDVVGLHDGHALRHVRPAPLTVLCDVGISVSDLELK